MILQYTVSSNTRIPCLDSRTNFTQTISETHTQQQTRQEGSFRAAVFIIFKYNNTAVFIIFNYKDTMSRLSNHLHSNHF